MIIKNLYRCDVLRGGLLSPNSTEVAWIRALNHALEAGGKMMMMMMMMTMTMAMTMMTMMKAWIIMMT